MDQSHLAYWEMDAATNTFTFNDQFYELYATTAEREGGYVMPSAVYAQNFLFPEDFLVIAEDNVLLLSGKIDKLEKEHRICRRDGEIRYIVVRINVVRDTNGLITGTRGSNQDITEMTLAKEALKKSEAELRELNATKDKFFSIIAHDLKSPFNAIMGFSDILVEQVRE
jgi:PAS domain S-box-containing protein